MHFAPAPLRPRSKAGRERDLRPQPARCVVDPDLGARAAQLREPCFRRKAAGGRGVQVHDRGRRVVQYGIILRSSAIARPDFRRLLALRAPGSYARALTTALGVFVVVYAISAIVSAFSDPGQEQGLTPDKWDSSRATPYVVNFLVFVVVAPVVEELTFRGLGYSLLEPLGRNAAVLWIGVAFGLAHGLLEALPILIAFGAGLALIRARTNSFTEEPGGLFNGVALIISVST
jgi:hypothetical protein